MTSDGDRRLRLHVLQGLPVTAEYLVAEIYELYNHGLHHLTETSRDNRTRRWKQELKATLARVRVLHQLPCRPPPPGMEDTELVLLESLVSGLAYADVGLRPLLFLSLLCLVYNMCEQSPASISSLLAAVHLRAQSLQSQDVDPAAVSMEWLQPSLALLTSICALCSNVPQLHSPTTDISANSHSLTDQYTAYCTGVDNMDDVLLNQRYTEGAEPAMAFQQPTSIERTYRHYRHGENAKASSLLVGLTSDLSNLPSDLKASTLNLLGCCTAKQDHQHSALQLFRSAAAADFRLLCAMYNISLVYRSLGQTDAELETLNLLTKALHNAESSREEEEVDLGAVASRHINASSVSLSQVQYTLAYRCLQCQKFAVGADKYLDILCSVVESRRPVVPVGATFGGLCVRLVYREAAFCLLQAQRWQDCVQLCDRLLEKCGLPIISVSQDASSDLTDPLSNTPETTARKRPRSEEVTLDMVAALCYKAAALLAQGESQQALTCTVRALSLSEVVSHQQPQSTHPCKKSRLDSTGRAVSASESASSCLHPHLSLYLLHCRTLVAVGRPREALRWSRTALNTHSGDDGAIYTHCVLLLLLERPLEAAELWLRHRGHGDIQDATRLQQQLTTDTDRLRRDVQEQPSASPLHQVVSHADRLQLDVVALQTIIREKHSVHNYQCTPTHSGWEGGEMIYSV